MVGIHLNYIAGRFLLGGTLNHTPEDESGRTYVEQLRKRVYARRASDNVMIYWVTETIHSSARLYHESRQRPLNLSQSNRVEPPLAVALFPKEIPVPPRALAERGMNVTRLD